MDDLQFVWDPKKNASNRKKHAVSFEEAQSVFYDENALEFYDDDHADWEERFLLLGLSAKLNLLLVCHCYREESGLIRIISARKATRQESLYYGRP